jgi:hypothetical protein
MREIAGGTLPVGSTVALHQVDMSKKIYIRTRLLSYHWSPPVVLHHPLLHDGHRRYGHMFSSENDPVRVESFLRMHKVVAAGWQGGVGGRIPTENGTDDDPDNQESSWHQEHSCSEEENSPPLPAPPPSCATSPENYANISDDGFLDIMMKREGRNVKVLTDLWVMNNTALPLQFRSNRHHHHHPSSSSSSVPQDKKKKKKKEGVVKHRLADRWSPSQKRSTPKDAKGPPHETGEEGVRDRDGKVREVEQETASDGVGDDRNPLKRQPMSVQGSLESKLERRMSLADLMNRNIMPKTVVAVVDESQCSGEGAVSNSLKDRSGRGLQSKVPFEKVPFEKLFVLRLQSAANVKKRFVQNCKVVRVLVSLPTDRHRFVRIFARENTVIHDLLPKICEHLHVRSHELNVHDYEFFLHHNNCLEKVTSHLTLSSLLDDAKSRLQLSKTQLVLFFQIRSVFEGNVGANMGGTSARSGEFCHHAQGSILMMGMRRTNSLMGSQTNLQLSVKTLNCNWSPPFSVPFGTSAMQTPPSVVVFQEAQRKISACRESESITEPGGRDSSSEIGHVTQNTYEIGIQFRPGEGIFRDTLILSLAPRFILVNKLKRGFFFRQLGLESLRYLEAGKHCPFHWRKEAARSSNHSSWLRGANHGQAKKFPRALQLMFGEPFMYEDNNKSVQSTACGERWNWSGAISLDTVGDTAVKMRRAGMSNVFSIIRVKFEQVQASLMVIVEANEKRWPPYIIENVTPYHLLYRQTNEAPTTIMGFNLGEALDEASPFHAGKDGTNHMHDEKEVLEHVLFVLHTELNMIHTDLS